MILNGKKAGHEILRHAISKARNNISPLEVRVTFEQGDVERLVQEAASEGGSRLIAAGGDGTLNEVINSVLKLPKASQPEVAMLPLGTANDFANTCLIPKDLSAALELALTGSTYPVDAISVNDRYFVNAATAGFGAQVTAETPVELKNFLGGGAYTLSGVVKAFTFKPYPGVIQSEKATIEAPICIGAICNNRQAGGGQPLAPNALIDDGLLDVMVVTEFPLREVSTVINELNRPEGGRYVKRFQASQIECQSNHGMPVNLDGEPYQATSMTVSALHHAVRLVLPQNCPVISE
jgi:lipid kinase YegS